MSKNLIIISHAFTPSNYANAKRPYLLARYLVRKGWNVTVLTSHLQVAGGNGSMQDKEGIHVKWIPSFPVTLQNRLERFPELQSLTGRAMQAVIFPDYFALWIRQVARHLRTMDYDCGILNIMPYSALLLQKYGMLDSRWIIDYQEPVYPFLEQRPRTSPFQKWMTPKLIALERQALATCGGVWFTAEAAYERYIKDGAVAASKAAYLPYFYDPEMYPVPEKKPFPRTRMTILYGGNLVAPYRSPYTFFKAWALFLQQHPEAGDEVNLVVYGRMDKKSRQWAADMGLTKKIVLHNPLPYPQFLAQTANADALLFIDSDNQGLFNPGKVADYLGSGRPIFAITEADSGVERLLQSAGMAQFVSGSGEESGAAECFFRLWRSWKSGEWISPSAATQYSLPAIGRRAEGLLEELVEHTAVKSG